MREPSSRFFALIGWTPGEARQGLLDANTLWSMKMKALFWTVCAVVGLSAPVSGRTQVIDHSNPSTGNDDLVATQSYAWGPMFLGGICRLTDKGSSETAAIFSRNRVNISQFETSFVFQILSGGPGD